jgi:hypothetical protein
MTIESVTRVAHCDQCYVHASVTADQVLWRVACDVLQDVLHCRIWLLQRPA